MISAKSTVLSSTNRVGNSCDRISCELVGTSRTKVVRSSGATGASKKIRSDDLGEVDGVVVDEPGGEQLRQDQLRVGRDLTDEGREVIGRYRRVEEDPI